MRAWGRQYSADRSSYTWVPVETDENGDNSEVYLTNLIQVLLLIRNESPFFANYGIPAFWSVIQQIHPDFYVWLTQSQFAPFFAALIISRQTPADGVTPTYAVSATTKSGVKITQNEVFF